MTGIYHAKETRFETRLARKRGKTGIIMKFSVFFVISGRIFTNSFRKESILIPKKFLNWPKSVSSSSVST